VIGGSGAHSFDIDDSDIVKCSAVQHRGEVEKNSSPQRMKILQCSTVCAAL
jgi:hypothetical protein